MKVMMGPTFSLVPEEYVRDRSVSVPAERASSAAASAAASPWTSSKNEEGIGSAIGIGLGDYSSDNSSSIGTGGDSEDEVESGDDNAVSCQKDLGSMSSLEDSLPINRRGLSNHYKGKSKSFGNLGEISSVKEMEKEENPLNKRRRLQMCSKRSRRAFYSWQNPKSMPLFPVKEGEEEEEKEKGRRQPKLQGEKSFRVKNLKSHSCFALSDLQEEEDE